MTMYKVIVSCVLLLQMIFQDSVKTYPFKCPHASHWRLRAKGINCSTDKYMCLYDRPNKSDTELCGTQEPYEKGTRLIVSGKLYAEGCPVRFYQPFNFWTNGSSSNCVYRKSICNEEGQATVSNGTESEDVACGCNSSAKYQFLSFKQKSCIPSKEDCTCYYNGTNYEIPFVATDETKPNENKSFVTETLDSDSNRHLKVRMRIDAKIGATCLIFAFGLIAVIFIRMIRSELEGETVTFGSIKDVVRTQLRCHQNKEYKIIPWTDPTTENTIEIESEGESNTDAKILIEADVGPETEGHLPTRIKSQTHDSVDVENGPETESHLPSLPTLEKDDSMDATNEPGAETSNTSISETLETETDGESTTEKENGKEMYTAFKSPEQTDNDIQLNLVKTKTNNPVSCTESHTDCEDPSNKTPSNEKVDMEMDVTLTQAPDIIDGRKKRKLPKTLIDQQHLSSETVETPPTEFQERQKNRRRYWNDLNRTLFCESEKCRSHSKEMEKGHFESILIIGPDGSGKSITAAHFGFKFKELGYELYFLDLPHEVNKTLKVCHKQVFVIHKPLGNDDMNKDLAAWENLSKSIQNCLDRKTKIIMTLNTRLYKMFEIRLRQTLFAKRNRIFDLSSQKFNHEQKTYILQKHKGNSSTTCYDEKILNEKSEQHFLIWCSLLSKPENKDVIDQMMKDGLHEFYRLNIRDIQQATPPYQYACIVLTVLFDGTFDINNLKASPKIEKIERILESCGIIFENINIMHLQRAFDELIGTYFKYFPTDSEYNILHDIITDTVIGLYGPKNLDIIIEYASPAFLAQYVGVAAMSDDRTNRCAIEVTKTLSQKFAKRLVRDLENGFISLVFNNPSFTSNDFVKIFGNELQQLDQDKLRTLMDRTPDSLRNPIPVENPETLNEFIEYCSPICWLSKLGLIDLLQIIYDKCSADIFIRSSQEHLRHFSPLHFAARNGHIAVVKLLVEKVKMGHICCPRLKSGQICRTVIQQAEFGQHDETKSYLLTIENNANADISSSTQSDTLTDEGSGG